jgi:putative CocE/NonD family hydrolase
LELFNHIRASSPDREARDNQYVIVAPRAHCEFDKLGPSNLVGERNLGDTTFDVDREIFAWLDRWLKDDRKAFPADTPHVRYYAMGENRWKSSAQWPPSGATPMRLYLNSGGRANSLFGDGRLSDRISRGIGLDSYIYDPANPVQSLGGNDCCNGGLSSAGAFDQRSIESRQDVLVYTSEPLVADLEVSGFVDAVLQVSSDAKDTDFTVKLVDVAPDATAWILGDTILRTRYREGYDREVWMAPGSVYTLKPTPIATSNVFLKGHRIRIEVTSSNFPKFFRNLNTGGDNVSEVRSVVTTNRVHFSPDKPSYIELPVVRR